MKTHPFRPALAAAAFALLAFTGCQSARMPIPDALAGAEPLAVQHGHAAAGPILRIGAYETQDYWRIEAGAPQPSGTAVSSAPTSNAEHYGFTLHLGTTDLWNVACARAAREDFTQCTFTAPGDAADAWTLTLKAGNSSRVMGMLRQGDTLFQVAGTRQTEGGIEAWHQTGYVVGAQGHSVAAVDFSDGGRVWLPTSDNIRMTTLMTAVSAALLVTEGLRTA